MTKDMPVAAILTPPGRGAVATIGVRGSGAMAAVASRFLPASGRTLEFYAAGRVVFGRFRIAREMQEELVVGLVAADQVEIHCHGGLAVVEAIAGALVEEGCRLVDSVAWTATVHDDPLEAAALLALSQARTERTAAVLLDQHRGSLHIAFHEIAGQLDAGDEAAPGAALDRLLARGEFGLHLTKPWRVALAGRPNAGKSSLMKAIVGYERAIVFEQPGTTRDVLTAGTAIDGWPIELADTAGLREAEGQIEAEGVARALVEISAADAVLFVADTTAAWDAEQYAEVTMKAKRLLVVHNKCDLQVPADDRPAGVAVSAKTGSGVEALCGAIAELLIPDPPRPGEAVPFAEEQVAALHEAAACLRGGQLHAARAALLALCGTGHRLGADADSDQY